MCTMTLNIDSGEKDAKDFVPRPDIKSVSEAGQQIAMLLSLQAKEWQELRSTSGVVLKVINFQEPTSGKKCLMIVFGSMHDDITGIDATLDVAINGMSVDDIVAEIARGTSGNSATKINATQKQTEGVAEIQP